MRTTHGISFSLAACLLLLAAPSLAFGKSKGPAQTAGEPLSVGQDGVATNGSANRLPSGEEGSSEATAQVQPSRKGPDKWMNARNTWGTFNGDLNAQKFATADQITPENVKGLRKAWEYHTGDVSDGTGEKPMSVWSATPLFVNKTLYVGTPFYRIVALDPGTGKEKWKFDPHAVL